MSSSTGFLPADFRLFSVSGIALSFGVFLSLLIVYSVAYVFYNVYFHPLAHVKGPFLASASGIPMTKHMRDGTVIPWLQKLHATYGDAVRVAPGEVSFISGESAWQDIYGFRTGKHKTPPYLKDRTWFPLPLNGVYSIIGADEEAHTRMRRNNSHAFSDKVLRDQEGLIQGFVDLLCHRLNEQVQEGRPVVDIMRWYNYTTFDVITDLTFGEPLYCLRDKDYHPWVTAVFQSVKALPILSSRRKYPMIDWYDWTKSLFSNTDQDAIVKKRAQFFHMVEDKVTKRIEQGSDRPDFMGAILKNQGVDGKGLTRGEMDSNAIIFMIAGSETTATLLSGATYLLLSNPEKYKKLADEIRGKFKSMSEITIDEVNQMDYLIACLQEGLRYYPPVPTGFPRIVPAGGDKISGQYIPEGTAVYVSQHAANHSTRNFRDPDAYVPERFLGDAKYKDDNRDTMQPFSFGPRNCLGKNLAYAEMRLILAKVLFNFDLELTPESKDWLKDQKLFALWEKPALMVNLVPVKR